MTHNYALSLNCTPACQIANYYISGFFNQHRNTLLNGAVTTDYSHSLKQSLQIIDYYNSTAYSFLNSHLPPLLSSSNSGSYRSASDFPGGSSLLASDLDGSRLHQFISLCYRAVIPCTRTLAHFK